MLILHQVGSHQKPETELDLRASPLLFFIINADFCRDQIELVLA